MSNPVTQFQILSTEPERTAAFYSELFGWSIDANNPMGYRRISTGTTDGISGGIWPAPPQGQNFVQLFITVENVTASVDKARSLGGGIIIPPTMLPEGDEMAVMKDPQGMPFAIWRSAKTQTPQPA